MSADLRLLVHALNDTEGDHRPLLDRVGEASFVLLGEGSHGTHDYYHERAEITKRLIIEKGFNAVAVEADWPDAYRINRFVRNLSDDKEPVDALNDFQRLQSFGFVMGNIDPRNAFDKRMATNVDRRYRREKFDRSSRIHENQSLHVTSSSAAAKL